MMARRDYFYTITDNLGGLLQGEEVLTCYFTGEDSDFVRFNRSRVRQAGHVTQQAITLDLIEGRRHAAADMSLSGDLAVDRSRLRKLLGELRALRAQLPEDPHLNYARENRSSEQLHPNCLPPAMEMVEHILAAAEGQDLVGILASGAIDTGFANSLGQRNWFSRGSFNLDWSLYLHTDKAVKGRYAGFTWQPEEFANRLRSASEQLDALTRPVRNLYPGRYRVYLTPMAVDEIIGLLGWGGFSLRAHRTGTTPLLRMVEQGVHLHPAVTITENTAAGIAPNFQAAGFIRPPQVTLIDQGVYRDCLVAPRSAAEYGVPSNAAGEGEAPLSVEVAEQVRYPRTAC
jgi:predicted Zn-dependent protease